MIIVGMTGPIGHGKSTFAKALQEVEPTAKWLETSMVIAEVVNALHDATRQLPNRDNIESVNEWLHPLPAILLEVVGTKCDFNKIKLDANEVTQHPIEFDKLFLHIDNLVHNPELLSQTISRENKEEYRPILQWIGGYMVQKVNPRIWFDEIIKRAYRADDQGAQLCIIGGVRFPMDGDAVHQIGGKIIKVYRPGHLQYDALDPTERERENITVDSSVISDSGIEEVKICARVVYDDLKNNRLQSTYIVSHIIKEQQDAR